MADNSTSVLLLFSSSEIGGAERSLGNMAISNSDKSVTYQIATFGSTGPLTNWINSNSKECYFFKFKILSLLKHIDFYKPDIIYVIGFRLSVLLRFYCKFFLKSYIIQGVRWSPSSKSKLDISFRFFERFFSFMLDGFIVNSKSTKNVLTSFSNTKVEVIYNGISNNFNQNQGVSKKKFVITLANLSERKGYKQYLKVIQNVVEEFPDVQFLFLGYDNLNGQIQKLIVKMNLMANVKYLGFQENVGQFLNESSIFVLPSLHGEGCPTSILEAFSFKLPVIANDIDGIPELVSHNVDGILTDKAFSSSIENAIKDLLLNPDRARKLGESGYKKVNEHFLLSNMLQKHNSFFKGL